MDVLQRDRRGRFVNGDDFASPLRFEIESIGQPHELRGTAHGLIQLGTGLVKLTSKNRVEAVQRQLNLARIGQIGAVITMAAVARGHISSGLGPTAAVQIQHQGIPHLDRVRYLVGPGGRSYRAYRVEVQRQ